METLWSKLSGASGTILERVDVNRRDLALVIGEELEIPYFKGIVTEEIVNEIKWYEKTNENEGYFETEQSGNKFTIKFLKRCF